MDQRKAKCGITQIVTAIGRKTQQLNPDINRGCIDILKHKQNAKRANVGMRKIELRKKKSVK